MPLPQRWHKNKKSTQRGGGGGGGRGPPEGFAEVLEPTLEALEHELRDKIKESNEKKRKTESMWPVYQINWQRSRYVYDMYYTYHRISKPVYDYCIQQKLIDAALIAKWKKPGYERLCSTYVINPSNYKFGTTSICRVPLKDRSPEAQTAQDPTTGCLGCASGKGAGPRNIFGNKYGQYLAAVQIAREERLAKLEQQRRKEDEEQAAAAAGDDDDDETDDDDDEEDEDDYGPTPAAGIWAGSQKLEDRSSQMILPGGGNDDAGDEETEDEDEEEEEDDDDEGPALPPPAKKVRQE